MKNNNKKLYVQMLAALALAGPCLSAQAVLPDGAVLEFNPGVPVYDEYNYVINVSGGSYFGVDTNGNRKFSFYEKFPLNMHDGIIIGASQPASGSHFGPIDGTEMPGIDEPWMFFGNVGMFQTLSPVTDYGDGTLDFSGLGVTWAGIPNIPLGDPAYPYYGGVDTLRAAITCSSTPCQVGDTYVLNYYGHVPSGDPSGFGGVWFTLHLEGTISGGPSRPRVAIRVDGGNQQECASHDGTSMTVNADITVPEGDELASIDWTLDGESIGSSAQLVHTVPLGTHTLAAEVQTLAGLSATSTSTLIVRDTRPPVVSAAFIDRQSGTPVTTISKTALFNIRASAEDVCDANPVVTSVVGLPVSDGSQLQVQVEQGWMRLDATRMNLTVNARDASGNSATGTASITVGN